MQETEKPHEACKGSSKTQEMTGTESLVFIQVGKALTFKVEESDKR
jgi:hypothetical protein